ncbi:hypothetical protein ACFLQW_02380 [Candidatus Zixiibacteriota bacterium]
MGETVIDPLGRLCTRKALAQLEIVNFPILVRSDRTPIWPAGIVGNISHGDDYCGVAVARQREIQGVKARDCYRFADVTDLAGGPHRRVPGLCSPRVPISQ